MDIEEPKTVQNLGAPPPSSSSESPMSPQRTRGLPSAAAQQMANILKNNKGSVTINDILNLCIKPPQPKVIRVPGVTNPEDELHFRGFTSANQLLEYLGVDTNKVRRTIYTVIVFCLSVCLLMSRVKSNYYKRSLSF